MRTEITKTNYDAFLDGNLSEVFEGLFAQRFHLDVIVVEDVEDVEDFCAVAVLRDYGADYVNKSPNMSFLYSREEDAKGYAFERFKNVTCTYFRYGDAADVNAHIAELATMNITELDF